MRREHSSCRRPMASRCTTGGYRPAHRAAACSRSRALPERRAMAAIPFPPLLQAGVRLLVRWQNWLTGFALVFAVLVGIRLWPHPSLQDWKPSSVAVYDDRGRLLRLVLASDDRYRLWVPLKDMSPQLVEAVLLREDRWYWWHPGFNPYGLARGAFITYLSHGRRQGG